MAAVRSHRAVGGWMAEQVEAATASEEAATSVEEGSQSAESAHELGLRRALERERQGRKSLEERLQAFEAAEAKRAAEAKKAAEQKAVEEGRFKELLQEREAELEKLRQQNEQLSSKWSGVVSTMSERNAARLEALPESVRAVAEAAIEGVDDPVRVTALLDKFGALTTAASETAAEVKPKHATAGIAGAGNKTTTDSELTPEERTYFERHRPNMLDSGASVRVLKAYYASQGPKAAK